jgi:plastocyanin
MMRNFSLACGLLVVAALVGSGCKDDSGNGPGDPGSAGTGGGSAGSGGTSGGGSGGTAAGGTGGGTPGFMSVLPCASESSYMTGATVNFGLIGTPPSLTYDPKCLKVPAGSTVTFSGDFGSHPLEPSLRRGAQSGNPITSTGVQPDGGMSKSFTFSTPGFFAYFCAFHDPSDTGNFMSGVIWVQ